MAHSAFYKLGVSMLYNSKGSRVFAPYPLYWHPMVQTWLDNLTRCFCPGEHGQIDSDMTALPVFQHLLHSQVSRSAPLAAFGSKCKEVLPQQAGLQLNVWNNGGVLIQNRYRKPLLLAEQQCNFITQWQTFMGTAFAPLLRSRQWSTQNLCMSFHWTVPLIKPQEGTLIDEGNTAVATADLQSLCYDNSANAVCTNYQLLYYILWFSHRPPWTLSDPNAFLFYCISSCFFIKVMTSVYACTTR